jgi:DNA-binding MarR family transcriptional regulator
MCQGAHECKTVSHEISCELGPSTIESMTTRQNRLRKQLSFALYSAANRMVRMHRPLLEPLGLTFSQYLVILELLDSAPVPVGELGNRLGMDTSTITPLVKRIELAGFVTRTRDVNDERRVMVDLTVTGRALESDVRGIPDKIESVCRLTEDDVERLHADLDELGHPTAK